MENQSNSNSVATESVTTSTSSDGQSPTPETLKYNKIYEDDLCKLYLGVESFGLSFHADFYHEPELAHVRRYHIIFTELCNQLKEKGINQLFTAVEDYTQYKFAEAFGFVDQEQTVTYPESPDKTEYQLMMKEIV